MIELMSLYFGNCRKLAAYFGVAVFLAASGGLLSGDNVQAQSTPTAAATIGQVEAAYATGMFSRDGYVVSVSATASQLPDKPQQVHITLVNFGNVRLDSLPRPKGAEPLFVNEATAIFTTGSSVDDAVRELRELLLTSGWQAYGFNDVSPTQKQFSMKQNAVQISLLVQPSPAQGGRTSWMISAQVLSADIPAPADAEQLSFVDPQKTLRFATSKSYEQVADAYRELLAERHWTATTESLINMKDKFGRPTAALVFRNPNNDLLRLDLSSVDQHSKVEVRHQTQQEVEEEERKSREAAETLVAEREERRAAANRRTEMKQKEKESEPTFEELAAAALAGTLGNANRSLGKPSADATVAIPRPELTKKVQQKSGNVLQITVPAGKGKAAAEFIAEQLKSADWKPERAMRLNPKSGNVPLVRGRQQLSITYVDTGISDVTVMITGIGVQLTPAAEEDSRSN